MAIKLIDASDVVVGKKRPSKVEVKNISKVPLKIATKEGIVVTNEISMDKPKVVRVVEPDISDVLEKPSHVDTIVVSDRTIKAIKLKEEIYYGPNDINKKAFVKMYKSKKLGLRWMENISIDGTIVSCWTNEDRSQYIIKLLEEGGYKRFKFYGCEEIYNYFISLGAITFDYTKENSISPSYLDNYTDKDSSGKDTSGKDTSGEDRGFIGADLWSGYRTRQLLEGMPNNWGVKWK